MTRSAKKRSLRSTGTRQKKSKPSKAAGRKVAESLNTVSKQARLIGMLRSPTGATIASMMKETDWQQHSVRGFLAGVVRRKLKLKLVSKKIGAERIYRVGGTAEVKVDAETVTPSAA